MAGTLISHFKFDNNLEDFVGSNDMTAGGSGNSFSTTIKKYGTHSLQLNGSGWARKASQTGVDTGNSDISFGGWIYPTTAANVESLGSLGVNSAINNSCLWMTKLNATTIRVDLASDALSFTVPAMSNTTWYHVWCEYVASTKTSSLYLNNALSSSGAQAHGANLALNATTDIQIGVDPDDNSAFTGNMDDWRFYNGITTAAQRAAIYTIVEFVPRVVMF